MASTSKADQAFSASEPLAPDACAAVHLERMGVSIGDLFHALQEGIWVIDANAGTSFVNAPMAAMLGYQVEEMLGRSLFDFMDERGRRISETNIARRKHGVQEQHEFEFLRKDGRRLYCLMATSPLADADGKYAGAVAGVLDISARQHTEALLQTEVVQRAAELEAMNRRLANQVSALAQEVASRKMAEAVIEQREHHYRSLFTSSPVAQLEIDLSSLASFFRGTKQAGGTAAARPGDGDLDSFKHFLRRIKILNVNDSTLALFGLPDKQAFLEAEHIYTNQSLKVFLVACRALFAGEKSAEGHTSIKNEGGRALWIYFRMSVPDDYRTSCGRVYVALTDLTEQRRLEQERVRYQRRLRALIYGLALSEQIERQHIAGILHDDIGQILLLSKLKLGDLMTLKSLEDVRFTGEEVKALLDRSIDSARSLTTDISPPLLYDLGFEVAAESLGRQLARRHDLDFTFITDHEPKPLRFDRGAFLYQCIRELLHNVVAHARASRIELSVLREGGWVQIEVRDNGVGHTRPLEAPSASGQERTGLFSMRERIQYIGGHFSMASVPDKGLTVELRVPLGDSSTD